MAERGAVVRLQPAGGGAGGAPVAAAGARRGRRPAGVPDEVRHREKWRPAPGMTDKMADPGGRGVMDPVTAAGRPRPVVTADVGYGDSALFREQLTARGWQPAAVVKDGTIARTYPPCAAAAARRSASSRSITPARRAKDSQAKTSRGVIVQPYRRAPTEHS
jgi:DDE superfamily endonuclease